ncbi:MAG: hypothetical protein WEF50_19940 [Myxococcota bacterium]
MTAVLKGLVALIGLLLGVLGLRWVFAPEGAATELGITLGGAVALNTARGDIGGLFVGGAVLCLLGLARGDGRWLQAGALLLGCVAAGRMVGVVVDGLAPQSGVAIAVELAMIALLLLTASRMAPASRR